MQNLPFEKVRHQVSTLDAQPSGEHGGIMVLVTGALLVRTMTERLAGCLLDNCKESCY